MLRRMTRHLFGTFLLLAASSVASAQADPPARVARVAFISGSVSFRSASVDEWSEATLNYPATIGDHLWLENGARAELEWGATAVRLGPRTEISLLNLDDRSAQLRMTQGVMIVNVRALDPDETLEIDTPNGAVSLLRPGIYRVDVNENGDESIVTARHGEAELMAAASTVPIGDRMSVVATGIDAPQTAMTAAPRIDEFEDWSLVRDRRYARADSLRYVPPEMIGYADLDQYGDWQDAPEYGAVWIPRVRAEWVPYRFGHWRWIEPWGWTWIDDAPWGFAPFHYGRWTYMSGRWGWVPGRIARPVYAPALVAFAGGNGWRASVSIGEPVAWFPLGPREVFVPAYRVSSAYVRAVNTPHVNVTNININVTNVRYVNRDVPGAMTAVPRDAFVRAQPVARAAVAVPREVAQAAPVGIAAPAQPQRASIAGTAQTRAPAPPPAAAARQVVVKTAPPPAAPGSTPPPVRQVTPRRAEPGARRPAPAQASPSAPAATPPPASAPTPAPQPAPPPPSRPTTPPVPAPQPAQPRPSPQPAAPAPPRSGPPPSAPQAPPATPSPDLAARHARERAELDARHAAERAQLQARHQEQLRRATDAKQRQQLQQQQQQEMKAQQERHRQEREATQKRHDEEKKR